MGRSSAGLPRSPWLLIRYGFAFRFEDAFRNPLRDLRDDGIPEAANLRGQPTSFLRVVKSAVSLQHPNDGTSLTRAT